MFGFSQVLRLRIWVYVGLWLLGVQIPVFGFRFTRSGLGLAISGKGFRGVGGLESAKGSRLWGLRCILEALQPRGVLACLALRVHVPK